jgi:Protein of unknown function (DUF4238)
MPAHKNQHFVPRCALKPFSLNGAGAAINLVNIAAKRAIPNAPVKGQCARDYLYGKENLRAEHLLMELEGHYAQIIALLIAETPLATNNIEFLRLFILVQMRRTEMAIEQMRNFTKSMVETAFARAPDQAPKQVLTDAQMMHLSMLSAAQYTEYVKDLKLVIFRNRTSVDFVTSDNPAVLTNRFHFQKLKSRNFGLSNSGAIMLMPLSPRLSAICYDTGVYSIANGSGTQFVDLTQKNDIHAVNQLEYIAAAKNIYFRCWDDAERIKSEIAALSDARAEAVPRSTLYVRDDSQSGTFLGMRNSETGTIEKYRKGTLDEETTAKETIVATSFQYPEPPTWPSKIRFREKPKLFYNGSAVGHVRKAEWLVTGRKT